MAKIYKPKGKAREFSPLALNYIKGCDHGCLYCYVPPMMKRFNKEYDHGQVNLNIDYKEIEISAKYWEDINQQILLSFTSDPYCNSITNEARKVLEILNSYGHKVAILTKGGKRCLMDLDIFKKFGNRIKVGASLTFDNNKDSKKWEPGAAFPNDRIKTLKILSEAGIKTWASFEPVIDPGQSLVLLEKISGFIDHVKIGKLNNYKGLDKTINWGSFLRQAVFICRQMNVKFYIKKDLAQFNDSIFLHPDEINEDYLTL